MGASKLWFSLIFAAAIASAEVQFNREVRPILSDRCFACHGPDAAARGIKLRLDSEGAAKADLGGRFAIVPGDVAKSEMIRRITAAEPARRMPPVASGRTLTPAEIDLIQRWIEQGAKWEKHWSFIPPRRAPRPDIGTQERLVAAESRRRRQPRLFVRAALLLQSRAVA